MVARKYIPDAGDFVWLTFDPQAGHEQRGRRPAIVLSPRAYNGPSGLAVACPITSRRKGYPFEVAIPEGSIVDGVVMADQLKSVDWVGRRAEFIGRSPVQLVNAVRRRLQPLLGV
ncbi:MAG: endoribonuclease MazF [Vicinamibacterales bacterium]